MKYLLRVCLLTVQLVVCVPFVFYLGSTIYTADERLSIQKFRSLGSNIFREAHRNILNEKEDGETEELEDDDTQSSRMITAIPASQQDMQITPPTTPFIPFGPDESPPRKPASIPTKFPIEEADFCTKRPGLEIISYVHSAISNVRQRNETRLTWGNATAFNMGVNLAVVFMVGRPKNDFERAILKQESERYHDIVQGDYGDHYRLLSYKGLAGIYWISKHCSHVPWTLHADDDIFIDIFLYNQKLKKLDEKIKKKFICSHMYGPALRSGRWLVNYEQYPAKDYPLYCSGGVWFLQTQYLPRLLNASRVVPFLWVDDAYLTGLLAIEAGIERHPFQEYYGRPKPKVDEVGNKVAWFYLQHNRHEWWGRVVDFHRNQTKYNQTKYI